MVENLGDEHCLVCNSICESMDFQSRLRLLLIVPFYIPVDRRRFRRFYEHRGRINCNSAMGRKCSQVWYYSLRKDDAQSLIQGAFLHLWYTFWIHIRCNVCLWTAWACCRRTKECKEAVQRYKIFKMMPLCLCACLCVCNWCGSSP